MKLRTITGFMVLLFAIAVITTPVLAGKGGKGEPSVAQEIIVDVNGSGDFATISEALNAIMDASATKRYLITVKPGIYPEAIVMKSYVSLKGVSRDATILQLPGSASHLVDCTNVAAVSISDLTLDGVSGGDLGIVATGSSVTISDTRAINFLVAITIYNSQAVVSGNIVDDNVYGEGIEVGNSSAVISNNVMRGNWIGILTYGGGNPILTDNVIVDSISAGIDVNNSSPTIKQNKIVNSGNRDIFLNSNAGAYNLSFNVFDSITNMTGLPLRGKYNVNSSGADIQ